MHCIYGSGTITDFASFPLPLKSQRSFPVLPSLQFVLRFPAPLQTVSSVADNPQIWHLLLGVVFDDSRTKKHDQ